MPCREHVAQLCHYRDQLDQTNVKVLIVSFGNLPAAQAWRAETCPAFQVLLDPERLAYRAYGLERSFWRSWNLRTIWRYIQSLTSGHRWHGIQGDSTQLGGDFIISADGVVQLAYYSHDPTDRLSAAHLHEALTRLAGRHDT